MLRLLLLISLFGMSNSMSEQTYNLAINITNIKEVKGDIKIGIHKRNSNFPRCKAFKELSYKVTKTSMKVVVKDLPKGEYAISLYHDKNSDGKCNTNILGVPKEAYGFSNNYKPILTAPSFDDCKVLLNKDRSISIKLIH